MSVCLSVCLSVCPCISRTRLNCASEVRDQLDTDLATLNQYRESFDSIKEVAELDDVDEIIARFLQQEAENFALFNYVTELNGEIETRQEEVLRHCQIHRVTDVILFHIYAS